MDTNAITANTPAPATSHLWLFVLLGTLVFALVIVFYWALTSGNRQSRHSGRRHRHHESTTESLKHGLAGFKQLGQEKKSRQRHYRNMNPTRAQTGGLPPRRPEGQPPASL